MYVRDPGEFVHFSGTFISGFDTWSPVNKYGKDQAGFADPYKFGNSEARLLTLTLERMFNPAFCGESYYNLSLHHRRKMSWKDS